MRAGRPTSAGQQRGTAYAKHAASGPAHLAPMTNALPEPSRLHATCAWCQLTFATIGQLLEHVDTRHLEVATDIRPLAFAPTAAAA